MSIDKDDFSTEKSWKKKPAIFYNKLVSLFILYRLFFLFRCFSRAFFSKICFLKRMLSGVTSQYSSSFKNSKDSSNVNCFGFDDRCLVFSSRPYVCHLFCFRDVDSQIIITAVFPIIIPSYTSVPGSTKTVPRSSILMIE